MPSSNLEASSKTWVALRARAESWLTGGRQKGLKNVFDEAIRRCWRAGSCGWQRQAQEEELRHSLSEGRTFDNYRLAGGTIFYRV